MPESFEKPPIQKKQEQERKTPEEIIVANLKKALKQRADKDYIARGLAGVNTKEAEEFKKRYFGHDLTLQKLFNWRILA